MSYLYSNNKPSLLKAAKLAFKDEISSTKRIIGFTRKEYFYFLHDTEYKYIFKPALQYYYNDKTIVEKFRKFKEDYDYVYEGSCFYPKIIKETNSFFIVKWEDGQILDSLTKEDIIFLKNYLTVINPPDFLIWYNSLTYNLIRLSNGNIKLIDLKHFDFILPATFSIIPKPFIYMYNEYFKINDFYEIFSLSEEDKKNIFNILRIDYPIDECRYLTINDL